MSDRKPTEFERRVLRYAQKYNRLPLGNKSIAWASAAVRMQKYGWIDRLSGGGWYVTRAGEKALQEVQP